MISLPRGGSAVCIATVMFTCQSMEAVVLEETGEDGGHSKYHDNHDHDDHRNHNILNHRERCYYCQHSKHGHGHQDCSKCQVPCSSKRSRWQWSNMQCVLYILWIKSGWASIYTFKKTWWWLFKQFWKLFWWHFQAKGKVSCATCEGTAHIRCYIQVSDRFWQCIS